MNSGDIYDRIIYIVGSLLAMMDRTMSWWVSMPANATGPLDPNITLTGTGPQLVHIIAYEAINFSMILSEALGILF